MLKKAICNKFKTSGINKTDHLSFFRSEIHTFIYLFCLYHIRGENHYISKERSLNTDNLISRKQNHKNVISKQVQNIFNAKE